MLLNYLFIEDLALHSCLQKIFPTWDIFCFRKLLKEVFSPSKDVNLFTRYGWSYRKSSMIGALSFQWKIKSCRTRNMKVPMKLVLWVHQPWGGSAGTGQRGLIMSCFFNSVWGVYQLIMSLGTAKGFCPSNAPPGSWHLSSWLDVHLFGLGLTRETQWALSVIVVAPLLFAAQHPSSLSLLQCLPFPSGNQSISNFQPGSGVALGSLGHSSGMDSGINQS